MDRGTSSATNAATRARDTVGGSGATGRAAYTGAGGLGGGGGGQGCIRREGTSEAAPEAVRQSVGGGCQSGGEGYCRLQMPLKPAIAVTGTVAGRRLGALDAGGGGVPAPPSNAFLGWGPPSHGSKLLKGALATVCRGQHPNIRTGSKSSAASQPLHSIRVAADRTSAFFSRRAFFTNWTLTTTRSGTLRRHGRLRAQRNATLGPHPHCRSARTLLRCAPPARHPRHRSALHRAPALCPRHSTALRPNCTTHCTVPHAPFSHGRSHTNVFRIPLLLWNVLHGDIALDDAVGHLPDVCVPVPHKAQDVRDRDQASPFAGLQLLRSRQTFLRKGVRTSGTRFGLWTIKGRHTRRTVLFSERAISTGTSSLWRKARHLWA